jgi:hypothetical protein
MADTVLNQMPENPRPTMAHAAKLRLDAVTMNIERREFRDLYENHKDELVSCHLYSDGSPVTGQELQGMVLEMITCSTIFVFIMPGVVLHFGGTRLIDKAFAFLWSLHLMVGVEFDILDWIRSKIRSITTDQGTESRLAYVPDILRAFLRRRCGLPFSLLQGMIDPFSRLLPYALPISGWGHLFGNLMHFAAKCFSRWPAILKNVRSLCRFFRNETNRKHIIDTLRDEFPEVVQLLKSFNVKIAKWRYETLYKVFGKLASLRILCERYLIHVDVMFKSSQETELISEVRVACRWGDLWVFMVVFSFRVLDPLEHARRWGLVCVCCSQARRDGGPKQSKCQRSSRRLKEARRFLHNLCSRLYSQGTVLDATMCEDVQWILIETNTCERRTATELRFKAKYLRTVPWLVVEADDKDMAAECVLQLQSIQDDKLTPLIIYYKDELLPSLQAFPAYIYIILYYIIIIYFLLYKNKV